MAAFIPNDTNNNIVEKILETKNCDNRNKITPENHDMYKKLIYRIVDGKHDFEGGSGDSGRSYITSKHCNDSILTKQLMPMLKNSNIDIKNVWIGKTLHDVDNEPLQDTNDFFSSLTDGANSIHPILDFISNIESIQYEDGQYIKIDVGYIDNGEKDEYKKYKTLFTFCMNRPFVGYYDIRESGWSTQLIADRNMYGKNAIYKIIIGDKKALKDKNKRNDINNIFKFNEHAYTIDASSLNKDEVLKPLFDKSSENIFGDAFDPSSIINGQTHGVLAAKPYEYSVNFHFCFLRGISIKINIKIVTKGQFEIQFSSETKTSKTIIHPSKPLTTISGLAPSVTDISLFIRDKIINMKTAGKNKSCFASLLATASKVIGKIKGQVPKDTNARVQYFTKFYFDIISAVETVVGQLDINEMMVVLTSIKTIGDQLRLKDALILKQLNDGKQAYCVSLDSFLRDSADGECNLLGDINSKKNFELVIHEKIDLEAQLKALKEVYNNLHSSNGTDNNLSIGTKRGREPEKREESEHDEKKRRIEIPQSVDQQSIDQQIAWYTTEINRIKQETIQQQIALEKQALDELKRTVLDSITNNTGGIKEKITNLDSLPTVDIETQVRNKNNTIMIQVTNTQQLSQDVLLGTYKYLIAQYYGNTFLNRIKASSDINIIKSKEDCDIFDNLIDFCNVPFDSFQGTDLKEKYEIIIDTIISLNNKYKVGNDYKLITNNLKIVKNMTYLYRYVSNWFGGQTLIKKNESFVIPDQISGGGGGGDEHITTIINNYGAVEFKTDIAKLYLKDSKNVVVDVNYGFYMDTIDILDYLYKLSLDEDNVTNDVGKEITNTMDVVNGGDIQTDKFEQFYDKIENLTGFNQFVGLLKQILQIPDSANMYNVEQIIDITTDVNNKTNIVYSNSLQQAKPNNLTTVFIGPQSKGLDTGTYDNNNPKRRPYSVVVEGGPHDTNNKPDAGTRKIQSNFSAPNVIKVSGGKYIRNKTIKKKSTKRKQTRRISYIKHKQTRKKFKSNKTKSNKKFKK